ncbi:MAG: hypothetical protein ACREQW_24090 [Candidatus Binatia bacterium]
MTSISRAIPSLEVRVFSPTEEHRRSFAERMSSWLGIKLEAVDSAREAVESAQIVSLATNSRAPCFSLNGLFPEHWSFLSRAVNFLPS